jgi:hypothetical protein
MLEIHWTDSVWGVFEELPARHQVPILKILGILPLFPEMYPIRRTGDFTGCRYFVAGEWIVYYRALRDAIWIRGLYPARAKPL